MINSWKNFVYAVDQMRELQKKDNIQKNTELYVRLKRLEAEVDEVCGFKIAGWNAKGDLFTNAGYSPKEGM